MLQTYSTELETELSSLVNNPTFADVIFVVGPKKRKYYGHQILLSVASELFKQCFYSGQPVRQYSLVEISIIDLDPDIFSVMLQFCYTGKIVLDPDNVSLFGSISKKFQITQLTQACNSYQQEILLSQTNNENNNHQTTFNQIEIQNQLFNNNTVTETIETIETIPETKIPNNNKPGFNSNVENNNNQGNTTTITMGTFNYTNNIVPQNQNNKKPIPNLQPNTPTTKELIKEEIQNPIEIKKQNKILTRTNTDTNPISNNKNEKDVNVIVNINSINVKNDQTRNLHLNNLVKKRNSKMSIEINTTQNKSSFETKNPNDNNNLILDNNTLTNNTQLQSQPQSHLQSKTQTQIKTQTQTGTELTQKANLVNDSDSNTTNSNSKNANENSPKFQLKTIKHHKRLRGNRNLKVALIAADKDMDYVRNVCESLYVSNFVRKIKIFKPHYKTPKFSNLKSFDVAFVYSADENFRSPERLGDLLAQFVEDGGGVVICSINCLDSNDQKQISGRFGNNEFLPFKKSPTIEANSVGLGEISEPSHPILTGVSKFDGGSFSYHIDAQKVNPNSKCIVRWSDGSILAAERIWNHQNTKHFGRITALNFWPPNTRIDENCWVEETDGDLLISNSVDYVAYCQQNQTEK
ncbi:btb (poz) domain-containing 2a-related [Anaeramoeba flamelloides]|uniref:Btb (Poz) domain-containing 2a-related n=1 Tax=Anaeramoeba flamelloides TaxID=1746091 RepID=A0ABQ8XRD4_9EUKA|nr:btb (poz) domain-containing 2a-related [Anaeramoeba flamelloides]